MWRLSPGKRLLVILSVGGGAWFAFLFAVAFINSWVG